MGQMLSQKLLGQIPHDEEKKSSIDSLSDEEILDLIEGIRDEDAIGFRGGNDEYGRYLRDSLVYRISHDAVVKDMYGPEAFMMTYVTSHTSIPIPPIRRVFPPPLERFNPQTVGYTHVVIDLIDGETLDKAWPTMSWWARLRVIWYIRSYTRQLHNIPIPYPGKPGPFDALGRRYISYGLYRTTSGIHPCESYDEMADWYDRRRFEAMVRHHKRTGEVMQCPKFDRQQPFVVCHGDIHPGNVIVDRQGIPWIIDWGEAGVFPIWADYAKAAALSHPHVPLPEHPPWLWRWSIGFMFGNYGKFYDYLEIMAKCGIWNKDPYDPPLDYFTKQGIDVD